MRDKDFMDDDYERGRDYRRTGSGYRSTYRSREGYEGPELREGYERNRYDRSFDRGYDRGIDRGDTTGRFSGGREAEHRYESRNEPPVYGSRYDRPEYAERDRVEWSPSQYRENYRERENRSALRARDIMTTDVVACRRDTNVREVARVMREEDTGVLPVVDENEKVIGVITDRDIVVRGLGDKDVNLDAVTVGDIMSGDVYSVRPQDRLVEAIRKMGNKQVRRIMVTDDYGRLKGIISMSDVATEAEYDHELEDAVEEISKPKSWLKRWFS